MPRQLQSLFSTFITGILFIVGTLPYSSNAQSTSSWPENPSTNVIICDLSSQQTFGMPVSDGAGGAIVLWEDHRLGDTLSRIYAQHIDITGRSLWLTDGIAISSFGTNQKYPMGISDGNGGAIIVWVERLSSTSQIVAQRINGSGDRLWSSEGIVLTDASCARWSPMACHDGKSGMIVAWNEVQADTNNYIIAQRVDSLGNTLWASEGIYVCIASNVQVEPHVVIDGNGGAIVQWTDFRDATFQNYCQRIDENGLAQWLADGVSICPSLESQYAPTTISSHDGGAIIVWHEFVMIDPPGIFEGDIYAQRVDASGNLMWGQGALAVCVAPNHQYRPTAAMDTNGGTFIAWYDLRTGSSDIYVQHVTSNGQISWPGSGIVVCDAINDQKNPIILDDGLNGIFAVWEDDRSSIYKDLYWQRIGIDGNMKMQDNGALLSNAAKNQQTARLVRTGAAGAIVIWSDYRSESSEDIYGDRILIPNNQASWGFWIGAESSYSEAFPLYIGVDPTALDNLDPTDIQLQLMPGSQKPEVWSALDEGGSIETLIQDVRNNNSSLGWRAQRWFVNCSTIPGDFSTTILFAADRIPSGFHAVVYGPDTGQVQQIESDSWLVLPSEPSGGTIKNLQVLIGDTVNPSVQVISPNGGETLLSGLPTNIRWNVSDSSGILKQYLYYIPAPEQPGIIIDSVDGTVTAYLWTPDLPALSAKIKIIAIDSVLNAESDTSDSYFTVMPGDSIGYTLRKAWSLIGLPLAQPDMSPIAVFGDDLGAEPLVIFTFTPSSNGYFEPSLLELGMGYWMYSFADSQFIDIVGTPIANVAKPLEQGWNIVGSPFAVPFPITSIRIQHGGETKTMAEAAMLGWVVDAFIGYDGIGYYIELTNIRPWQGYWLNVTTSDVTIIYDILLAKSSTIAGNLSESDRGILWSERIQASLNTSYQTVYDNLAVFGSASKATIGYDRGLDIPRPPRIPDSVFVELTFLANDGSNGQKGFLNLSRDIREVGAVQWPLVVRTSHEGSVTLTWDAAEMKTAKGLTSCFLIDGTTGVQTDMLAQSTYSYTQTQQTQAFEIQALSIKENEIIPGEFKLHQCYPNPFNPSTNITFSLPVKGPVSLKIYDLMGREVAVLVNEELSAGMHRRVFNANRLASGIYFYRLQANGFVETKKLSLIK